MSTHADAQRSRNRRELADALGELGEVEQALHAAEYHVGHLARQVAGVRSRLEKLAQRNAPEQAASEGESGEAAVAQPSG